MTGSHNHISWTPLPPLGIVFLSFTSTQYTMSTETYTLNIHTSACGQKLLEQIICQTGSDAKKHSTIDFSSCSAAKNPPNITSPLNGDITCRGCALLPLKTATMIGTRDKIRDKYPNGICEPDKPEPHC